MRLTLKDPKYEAMKLLNGACILFVIFGLMACTPQQYYEGLKSGSRSNCLEYPESEYEDCIEATEKSYGQYTDEREEIVGNQSGLL